MFRLGIVASVALISTSAYAVTYETSHTSDGEAYVVVVGTFEPSDSVHELVEAVSGSGARFVTFDSPGGNIAAAISHGRMIRALNLNTLQVRATRCMSACSLAFLGGVTRSAEPGSIGVHRSSFSANTPRDSNDAVAAIQAVTAEVVSYISEMGADPTLLSIAYSYDANDMRFLSASEMRQFRITNERRHDAAPQPPMAYVPAPASPSTGLSSQAAAEFVQSLLTAHSLLDEFALQRLRKSYAPTVSYYGKSVSLADVVRDKQDYFQRWPERAYEVVPGSVTVNCVGAICNVQGVYRWTVRSYPRNKQAAGAATFTYLIDTSQGSAIVGENSEVIERYKMR